jgi:hypothetical protein
MHSMIGCPICEGGVIDSQERGRKKVCLDVDQSYMVRNE